MKAKSNQQWTIRSNNQNSEGNRTEKHLVQTFGFFRSFNPKLLKRWCGKQRFGFPVHTSCPSINTSNKSHSKTTRVKAVVIAIALTTAVLLVLLTLHMMRKRKHQMAKAWKLTAFQRLDFKAEEVVECLKEETIIGKGGAGIVYRGSMPNGIARR